MVFTVFPWLLFKYSWQFLLVFFFETNDFVMHLLSSLVSLIQFLYSIRKSTKLRKVLLNKPFFMITLQDFFQRKQLVKSSLKIDSGTIIFILCSKRTWKFCLLLSIFKPRLSHFIHRLSLHYNKHIWLFKSQCISYHLLDSIM